MTVYKEDINNTLEDINSVLEDDTDHSWLLAGIITRDMFLHLSKNSKGSTDNASYYLYRGVNDENYIVDIIPTIEIWNEIVKDYGHKEAVFKTEDSKDVMAFYESSAKIQVYLEYGMDIFNVDLIVQYINEDGLKSIHRINGEVVGHTDVFEFIREYLV